MPGESTLKFMASCCDAPRPSQCEYFGRAALVCFDQPQHTDDCFWHAEPCNHGARLVKQASRLLVLGCVRRLVLLPGTKMMEDITMALRSAIEIRLSRMCSQRPAEAPVRSAQALQHYVGYYEEPCLYTVERDGRKVKSPWSSRLESFFRHADL